MADSPRDAGHSGDSGNAPGTEPSRRSSSGTPRWLNVLGILALVLILLFAVWLLSAGGHGPGRHAPTGANDVHTWVASGHESTGGASS